MDCLRSSRRSTAVLGDDLRFGKASGPQVKELEAALEEIEGSLGGCRNLAELLSKSIASKQQGSFLLSRFRPADLQPR